MRDAGKKDWKDPPANAWPKASSAERLDRYCGATILFAPQKELVKALSEARLD